jgi:1-phosphofructokinase
MIYTVTLNPTLDKTLAVTALRPGEIHRARFIRQDIGGKGINVSRALAALGIRSVPIGFLGGATGRAMREGLAAEGFAGRFVEVPAETRQNLTLLDESAQAYTKINEPGAEVGPEHLHAMTALCEELAASGDLWAFCGSLPPGPPPGLYAELIRVVQERGARAVLDTSGDALRQGLAALPFAVKPNREEAAEVLQVGAGSPSPGSPQEDVGAGFPRPIAGREPGRGNPAPTADLDAALRLAAMGIELVCLTRGAEGLILALGNEVVTATPPPVQARSPVGAGDATLAGLLWALVDGVDLRETARRSVACGTAAAMQEGTGVGDRELIEALIPQMIVRNA